MEYLRAMSDDKMGNTDPSPPGCGARAKANSRPFASPLRPIAT